VAAGLSSDEAVAVGPMWFVRDQYIVIDAFKQKGMSRGFDPNGHGFNGSARTLESNPQVMDAG
jgi:hypothetical protein